MGAATPGICVGVVLYKNTEAQVGMLGSALALARTEHPGNAFSLSVRDNSPDDGARALVAANLPVARYDHTPENRGFGATHNAMMREAFARGADHYVCLNPDAVPHPDLLPALQHEVARSARPGLVEAVTFPDEHPKPYDARTHDTPWCNGTCLLVSRALFEASGGFDEWFFMYCEDVDLSWRARAAGFSVRTAPAALVHHHTEDREISLWRELHVRRSATYLGAKYGDRRFAQTWRREYDALGGEPFTLPRLPRPPRGWRRVADFRYGLRFAESRW